MPICRLPQDAVDKIKSASAITSLNEVVSGLLRNSLDARSSKAVIHLDFVLGNCVLDDNGDGIEPQEFTEDGGLLKPHHTSKEPSDTRAHGRHGSFMANVAAFSVMTVTSCHRWSSKQAALSAHNGKVLTRRIPASPEMQYTSFKHGTRVSVCNLFGSMPVRVKQRGIIFSDRSRLDKEYNALVREIAALLLAWPSEVSVLLIEDNTRREIRIRSTSADLSVRVSRLFTQAGLSENENRDSWVPVSASSRRVKIKGAISTCPVASRRAQIMSLGIHPILDSFGTNVLYEEINKIFESSNFGSVDADSEPGHVPGKPRKKVERRPMFYLQIHLADADEISATNDVLGQSQHRLQSIIDLLKVVCYGFLKKYCLQPQHLHNLKARGTRNLTKQPSNPDHNRRAFLGLHGRETDGSIGRSVSPFDSWNRIRAGRPVIANTLSLKRRFDVQDESCETSKCRHVGDDGTPSNQPSDDANASEHPRISLKQIECESGPVLVPSGDTLSHGVSEKRNCTTSCDNNATAPKDSIDANGNALKGLQESLRDTIHSWRNPLFEPTENLVPALPRNSRLPQRFTGIQRDGPSSRFYAKPDDVNFEAAAVGLDGQLSRTALFDAVVIGQVDKKFILLQLPLKYPGHFARPALSSALVVLDQHAADERCQLEELMSFYFESNSDPLCATTQNLEEPTVFEVSTREGKLLERMRCHFEFWGLTYTTSTTAQPHTISVQVTRLPLSISERCQSDPSLTVNLIRRECWKLEDRNIPPRPTHESGKSWASYFHHCPVGILELLHSRSCRSAIMFNDELTMQECELLVQRLSRCAFPFQCAHGRPSMVPLVDIGSGSGRLGRWEEGRLNPSQETWKHWLAQP